MAFGALAFGATYPWAYTVLGSASLVVGLAGLAGTRGRRISVPPARLIASVFLVVVAGAIQLIPLPVDLLHKVSSGTIPLVADLDFAVATGHGLHPLSIRPIGTLTTVALFASFSVLTLALSRVLSVSSPKPFVHALAAVGVVVALCGIIQKPLYAGRIYGFWKPEAPDVEPFGPFVNKNHFAGWMLLALPLVIALLCAGIERSMRGVKPGVRNRVLWLSSPEANKLLLLATVAIVMGLSLVLTMSRSGMGALAVAVGVMGWLVARGIRSRSRRAVARGYLLFLTLIIVGWIGTDTIVSRFSDARWSEFNNRRGAWADALNVAATFPLTGTGLGTYATTSYFYQRHDLSKYYSEAHNDYFQLAAEGGLLVGLPILLCVGIFVNEVRIRMRDPPGSTAWWLRRGAITALVAISLQEVVEFSLQMPGNAVLFAVVAAIAIHQAPPVGPNQSPASRPYAAQAVSMRGLPLDGMEAAPSPPV